MEMWVLVRIDRDESGCLYEPSVRVFSTQGAAKDAMAKDFAKVKAERYPGEKDVFADDCGEASAYVEGTDDTDVSWFVKCVTVE